MMNTVWKVVGPVPLPGVVLHVVGRLAAAALPEDVVDVLVLHPALLDELLHLDEVDGRRLGYAARAVASSKSYQDI